MKSPISMKSNQEKIKKTAIRYFDGTIDLQEEKLLFDFINAENANKIIFKKWEHEWICEHQPNPNTIWLWERLLCAYQNRKKEVLQLPVVKRNILLRRVYQAVAVAALFAVVVLGIELHKKQNQEGGYSFVFETQNAEQSRVTLADGTVVWLNAATTLKCPDSFNEDHRTLELEGEAYFEVEKNPEVPFIVKAKNVPVRVVGTKFNVTAYRDEYTITAALLEGKLEIGEGPKKIMMSPDDIIRYNIVDRTVSKYKQNAKQYISWTEGRIEYSFITFDELFKRLSRQYDVNIIFTEEKKMDKIFNISLNNGETITDVLDALAIITPFTTRRDEKNLYITFK